MPTTDVIIDYALRALGEYDLAAPQQMTRADMLALFNSFYQGEIGKRLKTLAVHSYDGSDAAHTITAGVGTLPEDFLQPAQVYDGDAPDNEPLQQIFDIEDKVPDDADCSQYMLPDLTHIWLFGQTPANTIKLYYYAKPEALTDSSSSSPSALKEEFHLDVFAAKSKEAYEYRNGNYYDALGTLKAYVVGLLDEIEKAHTVGTRDDNGRLIKVV